MGIGHWALGIGHWALGIGHWALKSSLFLIPYAIAVAKALWSLNPSTPLKERSHKCLNHLGGCYTSPKIIKNQVSSRNLVFEIDDKARLSV
ncbi:MAG: hypothetical protein EAZ96_10540 [Oscillatoriales cyanobacterium]|nr:MAG: hypothetical protein EAZ96_10540 [Oscillatoriales cyanobacterium]